MKRPWSVPPPGLKVLSLGASWGNMTDFQDSRDIPGLRPRGLRRCQLKSRSTLSFSRRDDADWLGKMLLGSCRSKVLPPPCPGPAILGSLHLPSGPQKAISLPEACLWCSLHPGLGGSGGKLTSSRAVPSPQGFCLASRPCGKAESSRVHSSKQMGSMCGLKGEGISSTHSPPAEIRPEAWTWLPRAGCRAGPQNLG